MIAQGLDIVVEDLQSLAWVLARELSSNGDFRFEVGFHGIDQRQEFFVGEKPGANSVEPGKKMFSKIGVSQQRA